MGSELQFDKYALLKQGIYAQSMTSPQRIMKLIESLRPITTWRPLIRIGSMSDGGYLVPDDLKGISACFSPGVGPTAAFEIDLKRRFGIESHLSDYSVESPPQDFSPLSFQRKFIGAFESEQFTTMDSWIDSKAGDGAAGDLLLQMDIEGGEYPALLSLSERNLKRFRIIVAEIHHVENWCDPAFFDIVEAMFTKLVHHFHVVHIHPNNYGGFVNMGGIMAPRVFEIAFLRRDRALPTGFPQVFPHPLDRPCDPNRSDLVLPRVWYARNSAGKADAHAAVNEDRNTAQVFDNIYRFGMWGRNERGEAISGYGSHERRIVEPYVTFVRMLLSELSCFTVADLGCGDFNVGRHLARNCKEYIACDVSEFILARNRQRHIADNLKFVQLDLATGDLPRADMALVRQVLQHMENGGIKSFVERVNEAKPYRYMLVTEHVPIGDFTANADFSAGHDIRMAVDSGVVLHEAPFEISHKSRKVLLEVPADTHGRKALIRTTLYEF